MQTSDGISYDQNAHPTAQPRETTPIIDQVNAAVTRWPDFADQAGCTKKIISSIDKAMLAI